MKHNTLKKIMSLLLVICMMASFAGCSPGEADPTIPSHMEATVAPTEAATEPFPEATETTAPAEEETVPAIVEPATEPTDIPEIIFNDVDEIVYAISSVNIRFGPGTDYKIVGSLSYGQSIQRTGVGSNGWSRVDHNGEDAYISSSYLSTTAPASDTSQYPLTYSDATCNITITKEWYENAWCYIAHLQFSDYSRFGTSCANGEYDNCYETTSHAASRLDAIFAVNGCYSAPYLNYTVVRSGELCNGSGKNSFA